MAKKSLTEVYETYLRRQVEQGGGEYVGIQEYEGARYDLVLFNSPRTGSTLAVKSNIDNLAGAVRRRMDASNKEWSKS